MGCTAPSRSSSSGTRRRFCRSTRPSYVPSETSDRWLGGASPRSSVSEMRDGGEVALSKVEDPARVLDEHGFGVLVAHSSVVQQWHEVAQQMVKTVPALRVHLRVGADVHRQGELPDAT